MIAESIRTKVALLFILVILVILGVTPWVVSGDGVTLKSRVQNFLAYSLGSVGVLLSMLTIFLSCGTLANEIRQRYVFMVVTKPIPRWQFFAGKWLGILLLNGGLLLVTFIAVLGFTWYLKGQPASSPDDAKALQEEVLTVRHSYHVSDLDWPKLAQNEIRRLREEGRLDALSSQDEPGLIKQKIDEMRTAYRTLPPRTAQQYVFRGLMAARQPGAFLLLHFKPTHPGGAQEVVLHGVIQSGDPHEPQTLAEEKVGSFIVDRFHTVPIPATAINSDNTLYVRIFNLNDKDSIVFQGDDSIELLYPFGTFHWNLVRALAIIWFRLAFLAALGLLGSSLFSFPVACMISFLVLGVSSAAGYLGESLEWTTSAPSRDQPFWIFGPVLRFLAGGFLQLVPDFSKWDAVGNVVAGLYVPAQWVVMSFALLVLVQGLILGIIGCVVLTRRELAQVTV
jgi:hypothetical protein